MHSFSLTFMWTGNCAGVIVKRRFSRLHPTPARHAFYVNNDGQRRKSRSRTSSLGSFEFPQKSDSVDNEKKK